MTAGLVVDGITVAYGRMPAVRELSLAVAPGELVALLGRNGAGKSTTLRAIAGLQRVSAGSIALDGAPIHNRPAHAVSRMGVAMVLENARVLGQQTVAENLELGLLPAADRAAARRRRDTLLDTFPILREKFDDPAALLSGGERQQLAIAQALVSGPRLLLLDEPSVGLAPAVAGRVFSLVDELRRGEGGPGILVAEQQVARALAVVDRALVIDGGRVVRTGTAAELRDAPEVLAAYLGRARV